MDIFDSYIMLSVVIICVIMLAIYAKVSRDAALTVPLIASLNSLVFIYFAIDTVFKLAVKISTGENLYVYLTSSLPLIVVYLASSVICLASIPWLNLIAKRGEK